MKLKNKSMYARYLITIIFMGHSIIKANDYDPDNLVYRKGSLFSRYYQDSGSVGVFSIYKGLKETYRYEEDLDHLILNQITGFSLIGLGLLGVGLTWNGFTNRERIWEPNDLIMLSSVLSITIGFTMKENGRFVFRKSIVNQNRFLIESCDNCYVRKKDNLPKTENRIVESKLARYGIATLIGSVFFLLMWGGTLD